MDSLKRKLLLNIFVTPATVIAGALGFTLVMLSWVIPATFLLGMVSLLVAFGALATNLVFNMGKIQKKAAEDWYEAQVASRDNELDKLDEKLSSDRDRTDEILLRNLRAMYDEFCDDVKEHKISEVVTREMLSQVDEIFQSCVASLEYSYELLGMSKRLQGNLQDELKRQRAGILGEVEKSTAMLATSIAEIRRMKAKAKQKELSSSQQRLAQSLEVAKKMDQLRVGLDTADIMERYKEAANGNN